MAGLSAPPWTAAVRCPLSAARPLAVRVLPQLWASCSAPSRHQCFCDYRLSQVVHHYICALFLSLLSLFSLTFIIKHSLFPRKPLYTSLDEPLALSGLSWSVSSLCHRQSIFHRERPTRRERRAATRALLPLSLLLLKLHRIRAKDLCLRRHHLRATTGDPAC